MSLSSALTSFTLPGFFLRVLAPSSVRLEIMIYLAIIYASHSTIRIAHTLFPSKQLLLQHIFCNYHCIQVIVQSLHSNHILLLYCRLSPSWFCPAFLLTIHLYLIDTVLFPGISPLAYLYILPLLSLTSHFP